MSGAINIVVKRSRSPSMVRAAIIPGIAQAKLESNGIKALPLSPTLAISVSIKKAARAIYPDASSARMNANKIIICGRNTITAPTPSIIPSAIKLLNQLSGKVASTTAFNPSIAPNIISCGGPAQAKTA